MHYENKDFQISDIRKNEGSVSWKSPSNIALVKYWGKQGMQLPMNPSLSITLDNAYTLTRLVYVLDEKQNGVKCKYYFEGSRLKPFEEKVIRFLENITEVFPFLKHFYLRIESKNTFPHSAGIASSASSMSALALCLCSMEEELLDIQHFENFYKKASYIARLGSGSASRSVFGGLVSWGYSESLMGSSNEFSLPYVGSVGSDFNKLQDAILIVDSKKKSVSSRAGHALMNGHDFAEQRFNQARKNLDEILLHIQQNNWNGFAEVVENEALSLHSMMMTSRPSFILMKPETLKIIEKIQHFRSKKGMKLCFTLDAGPNLHLIYPESEANEIVDFIEDELKPLCENEQVIYDKSGKGPVQMNYKLL